MPSFKNILEVLLLKFTYKSKCTCCYPVVGSFVRPLSICWYCVVCNFAQLLLCVAVVDEKERKNGNDPEKELIDSGFHDYRRPLVTFVSVFLNICVCFLLPLTMMMFIFLLLSMCLCMCAS